MEQPDGLAGVDHACRMGLEGIVSGSRYRNVLAVVIGARNTISYYAPWLAFIPSIVFCIAR